MNFKASPTAAGGRAYGVAMWALGSGLVVMIFVLMQASRFPSAWLPVARESVGAFFFFLGIVAGAHALPNTAERLPGERRYHSTYGDPERFPENMEK
jgi:hypothetical protein